MGVILFSEFIVCIADYRKLELILKTVKLSSTQGYIFERNIIIFPQRACTFAPPVPQFSDIRNLFFTPPYKIKSSAPPGHNIHPPNGGDSVRQ